MIDAIKDLDRAAMAAGILGLMFVAFFGVTLFAIEAALKGKKWGERWIAFFNRVFFR